METNRLELEDVGLTGLYILDCRSLMELAQIIGRWEDISELQERMNRACSGLENLWDEENAFYYNRRTDTGEFSRRISPTNFYALFSPHVSSARQRRMADEHYYNPNELYMKTTTVSPAKAAILETVINSITGARCYVPLRLRTPDI